MTHDEQVTRRNALGFAETTARAARNTSGMTMRYYRIRRNGWMREARRLGTSTWEIQNRTQLSASSVRRIVKGA